MWQNICSASRTNGQTSDPTIPPASIATTLEQLTQPVPGPNNRLNGTMPGTNEASLVPSGPAQPPVCTLALGHTRLACSVEVGSQVRTWVGGSLPNHGFAVGGPTGEPDANNLPQGNDAKVSFYTNFALAVLYNPALNRRAPR